MPPKRALGRGLADLIPVGGDLAPSAPESSESVRQLAVGDLHRNPQQPRSHFDEAALQELADSIRSNGILQPILARKRAAGGYEIVAGERRWRAAQRAELTTVPVIVRELSDEETLAVALIENLLRSDIAPLETARAFRRLMDNYGWTQEEMARRVGKSRPAVANSLRLLQLPAPILESLEAGAITEGHARALMLGMSSSTDPRFADRQTHVWMATVRQNLSVRETERMMATPTKPVADSGEGDEAGRPASRNGDKPQREPSRDGNYFPELRSLEDRLRGLLGVRVRIAGNMQEGKIEIEYYSGEDFESVLSLLGINS